MKLSPLVKLEASGQISHHKASGRESWGLVNESLKKIEAAQARGIDVHADQYPYTAGSTSLQADLRMAHSQSRAQALLMEVEVG